MNIVILGAGEVGRTIIGELQQESDVNITAVDLDGQKLTEIHERFQVTTVHGHASHPDVQRDAGVADADVVLAVTGSDEVNMVACQVAYTLFNSGTRIARIRSDVYTSDAESLFAKEHMPIDVSINPEQVVTDNIVQLIEQPGSKQVLTFANGRASLASFEVSIDSWLVNQTIGSVHEGLTKQKARVVAIHRENSVQLPDFDTQLRTGDEIFVITPSSKLKRVMRELVPSAEAYRKIMIAGGGHIGERLARRLERDSQHEVKIAEINDDRIDQLSQTLDRAITLRGDATDREFLLNNNVDKSDLFCAVTNDDEVNVMSSLLAKRMGVRHAITLIGKVPYVQLIGHTDIDVAISPQQATASSILSHVRERSAENVQRIKHGEAEVLEMVAIPDHTGSRVTSRRIDALKIPFGSSVCAVVRDDEVHVDLREWTVEQDDRLIFIVTNKKHVEQIQRLFRPSPFFF